MERIKIREATGFDKDMWVELNKEFMEYEANDSEVWNHINRISERDLGEVFDDAMKSKEQIMLLMIELDGFSVGFINVLKGFSIWSRGKSMTIDDMYVRDEYRDQGVGSKAMEFIENYAKENQFRRVQALGNKTNKKSNIFYVAKGYMSTDMNLFIKYFD